MTMTSSQGAIWKQIAQVYDQWDPERHRLMPVKELSDKLPTVPPEMIGETLAQAASDQLAELGSIGENPEFRPLTKQA
ncbi:hypothetical protein [Noviherbaspirillum massiliense]|uniref:hypothetical protein n=1 Tax=Noviherbaspirillum massiliense TaxID=1465823 RepID=UPI00037200CA|nr:hypothetical protein [Noviherbaspirillum massiliense]